MAIDIKDSTYNVDPHTIPETRDLTEILGRRFSYLAAAALEIKRDPSFEKVSTNKMPGFKITSTQNLTLKFHLADGGGVTIEAFWKHILMAQHRPDGIFELDSVDEVALTSLTHATRKLMARLIEAE
jgi:hypothetical protein